MSAKPYNGHPSWNAWNVSLWIGNDEPLYRHALTCIERSKSVHTGKPLWYRATCLFIAGVPPRTPDGARYSPRSVTLALKGLAE